jgi:ferredoxin-NADP reductase/DMSO/TMAO reductase YedYZ heme-binding membrane subunit
MNNTQFAKYLLILNGAVPLTLLGVDALGHHLGANPVNFAITTTGLLSLIFLSLTILVTPVKMITGWNWLVAFRRTLGLYGFFYALFHFGIYFFLDQSASVSHTASEIVNRLYLTIGFTALLVMVPLAVTSTNWMVRKMGLKNWQLLHRLTYLAVAGGAIHFYMQAKSDKRLPTAFFVVIGVLLAYRLVGHYLRLLFEVRRLRSSAKVQPRGFEVATPPKYWTGQLRVARTFDETPNVRTFRLVSADGGDLPFVYQPGQYANLSLDINGTKIIRSYTIASSPTRRAYCELTIKKEQPGGGGSLFMHSNIHEGDLINISAPAGRFTFTGTEADSIVLIGGGVGITPLMSVIRYLTDRCWKGDIYLAYCAKTPADLIFRLELEYLAGRFPNFHPYITLSRAQEPEWTGPRGRLTKDSLMQHIPQLATRLVHICGPTEMMDPVRQMLTEAGVPAANIKTEVFVSRGTVPPTDSPSTQAPAPDLKETISPMPGNGADQTCTINFARSKKTLQITPQTTVLEAAENAGIDLPYDCRSGFCGTCKTKLTAGQVAMDIRDALQPSDDLDGIILACQAKPVGDIVVEA